MKMHQHDRQLRGDRLVALALEQVTKKMERLLSGPSGEHISIDHVTELQTMQSRLVELQKNYQNNA